MRRCIGIECVAVCMLPVKTEMYNHFHKCYSVQAARFHACSQLASVRQCLEQPSDGISSSQDKMARRRTGSSVGGVGYRA